MAGRAAIGFMTWVGATLFAVAIAWVAVSHAVAGIADPIPNIMGRRTHHPAIELRPAQDATHTIVVPSAAGTASSDATGAVPPGGSITSGSTATQSGSGAGGPATGALPPSGTPRSAGTAPVPGQGAGGAPAARPPAGTSGLVPAPTTTTVPSTIKSFGSVAGTITVRCTGDSIALVSAAPQSGYTTDVSERGPDEVDVDFTSSSHEYSMQAVCHNGVPAGSVDD
jgi:hypothetical protein